MGGTVQDGPERVLRITRGAMLYDASRSDQPRAQWFDAGHWREHGAAEQTPGGRGTICFLRHGDARWVLRHYRRGGLVARLVDDRYLWTGESRTRSFAEWRLLQHMLGRGLPVPTPIAACYRRAGAWYRADLITAELPTRLTLAQAVLAGELPAERWREIGRCIQSFHAAGVHHADLNAHNVLLGRGGCVYLIDFDRGRRRPRGSWESTVLERLQRSLVKVSGTRQPGSFEARHWTWLREGYALAEAAQRPGTPGPDACGPGAPESRR